MLSPGYLDVLAFPAVLLWRQVEDDILRDIARRIAGMDGITETAAWQAYRLEQTRLLRTDVVRLLAKYSGKSEAVIRHILRRAGADALAADDAAYRAAGLAPGSVNDSAALLNLLNAGYRQTSGTWHNLTATTANTVSQAFEDRLSRAWLQVSSGALDYQTAIKRSVDDLADALPGVTYPSGHKDTLEVACRRAVLTGVNQTAAKLQIARMDEMGCAFVEVTAHAGARPTHEVWQGKVYHRGGAVTYEGTHYDDFVDATGYGTGPGLCGWNCRHNFFPFFPGISVRAWDDAKLAELCAKTEPYNGRMYTKYELSQMQRALERRVRSAKKRYLAEEAAGLDTGQAAAKLSQARAALKQYNQATGARTDSARTGTAGFGRSAASKATWKAKNSLPLRDISIGRSIGAKAKNYIVIDKTTGKEYHFTEGSRMQNSQVFAGKGVSTPLHEEVAQGLAAEFGGLPDDWQHCKALAWIDADGESIKAEVHWFQNGRTKEKFKVKRWFFDD